MKAFLSKKLTAIFRSIKEKDILDIYRSLIKKQGDDISEIEQIIYTVMGSNCKIIFNEVDEIEPTKTGKFLLQYLK
tara:strand:+ start:807 stop:1034 length:228 start_codon:yes stop_codon:yes gene_type:complete